MEQIGVALDFFAFFTASKAGKTGLTVTVGVRDRAGGVVVAAGTTGVVEIGLGGYRYTLAAGSNTAEGGYMCVFSTTDSTVDLKDVPSLWVVNKGGIEHLDADVSSRNAVAPDNANIGVLVGRLTAIRAGLLDNLDVAVSSRNSVTPLSAAQVAAAVLDAAIVDHNLVSTFGFLMNNALDTPISSRLSNDLNALRAAVWATPVVFGVGTIGQFIQVFLQDLHDRLTATRAALLDNIDVAVSSRNDVAPDNAGIATLLSRLSAVRAALMDNMDVLVSSRLAAADYVAGGGGGGAGGDSAGVTELLVRLSEARAALLDSLTMLDVPVSTRATTADLNLAGANITVVSPIGVDGTSITIVQGDTYDADENRALSWTGAAWPDLTDAAVVLHLSGAVEFTCTVVNPNTVSLELTAEQTAPLSGQHNYRLVATLADGHVQTLLMGTLLVKPAR